MDLEHIKVVYLGKYNKTLSEAIKSETSGDFRKILLAIIDGE